MRRLVSVSLLGLLCVSTGVVSRARAQGVPTLVDYFTMLPSVVIDDRYSPRVVSAFPGTADLNGDGHEDWGVRGADYPRAGVTSWTRQPGRRDLGVGPPLHERLGTEQEDRGAESRAARARGDGGIRREGSG